MATTWAAIRANITSVLQALTPDSAPTSAKFDRAPRRYQLKKWASTVGSGALRKFELRRTGSVSDPQVQTPYQVQRNETAILQVVYPALPALYGTEDYDTMEDAIRTDANQIRNALFSPANYLSGQQAAFVSIDEPERVTKPDGQLQYLIQKFTIKLIYDEATDYLTDVEPFSGLLTMDRDTRQTVPSGSGATGLAIAPSGHIEGVTKTIVVPAGTATSFAIPPDLNFSGDAFDAAVDWYLFVSYIAGGFVSRGQILADPDTTAPTIISATVYEDDPDALEIIFSEPVYTPSTTGLSLTGTAITISSVSSGNFSDTLYFALSGSFVGGETPSLVVSGTTLQDLDGNTLGGTTVSVSVFPADISFGSEAMFRWRADRTVNDGATISQWTDISDNSNHAVQATAAARANYLATGGPNSQAAADFDGSADYYLCSSPQVGGTDPADSSAYTFWCVFKLDQGSNDGVLLGTGDPGNEGAMPRIYQIESGAPNGIWFMVGNSGDGAKAALADTNWHYIRCVHTTAARSIYLDGTLIQTTTASNDPSAIRRIIMGTSISLAAKFDGRIAEMGCLAREFSGAEVTEFDDTYMPGRYGL